MESQLDMRTYGTKRFALLWLMIMSIRFAPVPGDVWVKRVTTLDNTSVKDAVKRTGFHSSSRLNLWRWFPQPLSIALVHPVLLVLTEKTAIAVSRPFFTF